MKQKNILVYFMIFMATVFSFFQKPIQASNLGLSAEDKVKLSNTSKNIEKLMADPVFLSKVNLFIAEGCSSCSGTCTGDCSGTCSDTCSGTCQRTQSGGCNVSE